MMPVDHVGVAHPGDAALRADVGGHPLQRHDGDRAGVLGDLRLLGRDDVHDHAALELLGHAALDAVGAGAGGGGGGLLGRRHGVASRIDGSIGATLDRTAAQRPRLPARPARATAARRGRRCRSTAGSGARAVQPQQPGQPPRRSTGCRARRRCRTAGPGRPGARRRPGRPAGRPGRRQVGRQLAQLPAEHVLGQLPVAVDRARGRRPRRPPGTPPGPRPAARRVVAGQLLGQPRPAAAAGCPGPARRGVDAGPAGAAG